MRLRPSPLSATRFAAASSASGRTTSSISPVFFAFFGGSALPMRISGSALRIPMSCGMRTVPPQPGRMPTLVSGRPMLIEPSSAETRQVHASANSYPPPRQSPLIAATVGNGRAAMRL